MADIDLEGMTLFDFANAENQLTRLNHGRAGDYAHFAEASTAMFASTITHVPRSHYLFMGVYSMVRKHLVLAVLSALRQHKVQTALNLRQAIEGSVAMFYLIATPEPVDAETVGDDNKFAEKLNEKARKWLKANYSDHSDKLKSFKDDINATDSHSNIVNSYATFDYTSLDRAFSENLFFDRDDEDILLISLWNIGHITTHIIGTFGQVVTDHEGPTLTTDIDERITWLAKENDRLLALIQSKPRWQEAFANITAEEERHSNPK